MPDTGVSWQTGIMVARAMTLRLDDDIADDLATVAAVDGKPMADVVRQAVSEHLAARRADPAFRAALRAHIGRVRRLLGDDGD